jgi:hypothetical protein
MEGPNMHEVASLVAALATQAAHLLAFVNTLIVTPPPF